MPDPNANKSPATVAKPIAWERPLSEINATIRKTEDGNAAALEAVRKLLASPSQSHFRTVYS
ncbi:MAG: hypothetical protein K8U57_24040 [Planctomycetes bacterium]|nr:hypothetical protein [Planctomycetota bacterium]